MKVRFLYSGLHLAKCYLNLISYVCHHSELSLFTYTREPISSDFVAFVAFTVIATLAVTAKLCALVLASCTFILIWNLEQQNASW